MASGKASNYIECEGRIPSLVQKMGAMMKSRFWVALLFLPACGYADETKIQLKDAPGRVTVMQNCGNCHSLDYIPLNSVFLDRKGWEAGVAKMINAFGAPIAKEDVPSIVDYLSRNYGK